MNLPSVRMSGRVALLGIATLLATSPVTLDAFSRRVPQPEPDIITRLEHAGNFTTLLTALEVAGLKETVRTARPLTLFAPSDAAFATLPEGTVEALVANVPLLTDILLYHVLGERAYSYSLIHDSTATTLEGNPVLVIWGPEGATVNQIPIARANFTASNGVIHVLNEGVLLPPAEDIAINSVVDVLKLDGRFSILLAAAEAAGLAEALATLPAYTLFAPTDDAFAALPEGTVASLLANPEALANILLYHVLPVEKGAFHLLRERQVDTLQGQSVDITVRGWKVFINDAQLLHPTVQAPNGIIHVIDSVLLPPAEPPSLVELLVADGRFTTLVAAVQAAGLAETLQTGGPFTVFAPTDAAFAKLPAGTVESLLANPTALANILLYHVVDGEKSLKELRRHYKIPTLQGADVRVFGWYYGHTFINRSRVIEADLAAGNGVAHAIDTVLLPPASN